MGICCMSQGTHTGALYQLIGVGWGERWEVGSRGRGYVAQWVKNLPAMRETWVQSLGWEDPLEKGKATHSSILAWRIPRTV